MFAGHIGTALAIGSTARRINIGLFILAAMLLDLVLWVLVLLAWEYVLIPADFPNTHQPHFEFPYSHGLLASVAWSVLAGAVAFFVAGHAAAIRMRAACAIAAAVFSHWLLDALVHAPELPLAGSGSGKLGLGLWNEMPMALAVEAAITLAGAYLFLAGSRLPRRRAIALAVLTAAILAFTIAGMTIAPAPPSVHAMALSSLLTIAVATALFAWLGRTGTMGRGAGE